jgi:hypothetical protein
MENKKKKAGDAFAITGNWANQSKVLREKFSKLTEADLKFEPGSEEHLLKRIGTRIGRKREQVISIIKNSWEGTAKGI